MKRRHPARPAGTVTGGSSAAARRVWLFDLDDTLHDAGTASMPQLVEAMTAYTARHTGLSLDDATALRRRYWLKYGATLLGLVRHHGVQPAHFLHQTHLLPGLEARLRWHAADLHALARLPGRKFILTNAPLAYARRVLGAIGIEHLFDGLLSIEDMQMFGHLRPKPDARMLRHVAARLKVPASRCTLVEDTLVHQKAACSLGMGTVWMQRWLPDAPGRHQPLKPAYVGRRVNALRLLHKPGR